MIDQESAFRPLKRASSLRDSVEKSLSTAIVSGELAPGSLISVPSIAGRLGVSATPVREAMLNLEERGFLEPVKNKGFRVTQVSERDIREIVQIRSWLEGSAMSVVATKMDDVAIKRLRELADQIVGFAAESNFPEFLTVDVMFHLELLAITGNKRLVDMVAELRSQTRMVRMALMAGSAELKNAAQEHQQLLKLLEAGDAVGAEELMVTHVGHVIGWWSDVALEVEQRK